MLMIKNNINIVDFICKKEGQSIRVLAFHAEDRLLESRPRQPFVGKTGSGSATTKRSETSVTATWLLRLHMSENDLCVIKTTKLTNKQLKLEKSPNLNILICRVMKCWYTITWLMKR